MWLVALQYKGKLKPLSEYVKQTVSGESVKEQNVDIGRKIGKCGTKDLYAFEFKIMSFVLWHKLKFKERDW